MNVISQCNHLLYVTQPKYQETPSTCQSSISQQDIVFDSFQFCGLTVPSTYSGHDIQFNVTGYSDGQYNWPKKRSTKLRLTSFKSSVDLTGAWDIIKIPDIEVITVWNIKSLMSFPISTIDILCLRFFF